jgi:hypothetical protein
MVFLHLQPAIGLGFHNLPKNKGIYSHIQGSNIIIVVKWMNNMGIDKYLFKSTTRVKELQQD